MTLLDTAPLGLSAEAKSGSSGQPMAQDCLSVHLMLKLQLRVGAFYSYRPDNSLHHIPRGLGITQGIQEDMGMAV